MTIDVRGILQKRSWSFQSLQDWTEWFQSGMNWRNFHLIVLEYEDEICMGQREIVGYLLGLGFRLQWCYNEKAKHLELVQDRMAEIMAHPEAAIPLAEALEELGIKGASDNGTGD